MITEKCRKNYKKNILVNVPCFDLELTLDCGQAFRWSKKENGEWHGIAFSKPLTLKQTSDGIELIGTSEKDFEEIWKPYFDLERNYDLLCQKFSDDEQLKRAVTQCYGIRLLRQEPWEALCSFIISQNNNIPRIKGIIDRLCRLLGDRLGDDDYTFPSPQKIVEAGTDALAPIRAGFRAKYITDAAQKVANGEIDFEKIANPETSLEEGRDELIKIKGVGEKVAQCTLLYGCGKINAFPIDVWVKRILAEDYPNGLPECIIGAEGIAQQYLFHWKRTTDRTNH